MIYNNIVEGIFIERVNRFIARVLINNKEELAHVKNTGRCLELFIKGAKIYLQKHNNQNRKTKYSIISIYKGEKLVNIDSQVPNHVVYEGIKENKISEFSNIIALKKEAVYKSSRFDLYYEAKDKKGFIEVKGVTLEKDGISMFPDAPTKRGKKHILELIEGSQEGYVNFLFFLIQINGIKHFKPNALTDPDFSNALYLAKASGVGIILFDSLVTENSILLNERFYLNE